MDGIIIVDKPKGYTSRDIVNNIESILNTKKVGHGGTLDPIATGVLVIAIGNGLKILEFLSDKDKEYIATVKMGVETDTLDITGNIVSKKDDFNLDIEKLKEVLNSFIGKYEQTVPLYSSVRVDGKRLYKYARENIDVILPKREVEIKNIELINYDDSEFTFKVSVSKGTYIRSLIKDIGEKLNLPCTMKELRRTRQGYFKIDDSFSITKIENKEFNLIPIDKALKDIHFINADDYLEKRILNGSILNNLYNEKIIGFKNKDEKVIALYQIYEKDNTKIKPLKVFK